MEKQSKMTRSESASRTRGSQAASEPDKTTVTSSKEETVALSSAEGSSGAKRSSAEMTSSSSAQQTKRSKAARQSANAAGDNVRAQRSRLPETSWGLSKFSGVEEQAARETAAAVLQGLNRNAPPQRAASAGVFHSSQPSSSSTRQSGRMAQRRSADAEMNTESVAGDSSKPGKTKGAKDSTSRAKAKTDDPAARHRLKLTRKHQAADWVRDLTAQWTDVTVGRECLLGLRSFEPTSIKPEKRMRKRHDGSDYIDDERTIRRAAGAMKILQAGLVLPYSFGPDRGYTYHTVYLKKSVRGVGLKVRVIDHRVVVRGFASWFDSSRNNVRVNDVIAAANAIDACSGRADRIMTEFIYKPPASATEKISVGMSLVEETVCVRIARPNIYADVAANEPRVVASVPLHPPHVQATTPTKDVEVPKAVVAAAVSPVRVRVTSVDPSTSSSSVPSSDKRAPRIMPKVSIMPKVRVVVPGGAKS